MSTPDAGDCTVGSTDDAEEGAEEAPPDGVPTHGIAEEVSIFFLPGAISTTTTTAHEDSPHNQSGNDSAELRQLDQPSASTNVPTDGAAIGNTHEPSPPTKPGGKASHDANAPSSAAIAHPASVLSSAAMAAQPPSLRLRGGTGRTEEEVEELRAELAALTRHLGVRIAQNEETWEYEVLARDDAPHGSTHAARVGDLAMQLVQAMHAAQAAGQLEDDDPVGDADGPVMAAASARVRTLGLDEVDAKSYADAARAAVRGAIASLSIGE